MACSISISNFTTSEDVSEVRTIPQTRVHFILGCIIYLFFVYASGSVNTVKPLLVFYDGEELKCLSSGGC